MSHTTITSFNNIYILTKVILFKLYKTYDIDNITISEDFTNNLDNYKELICKIITENNLTLSIINSLYAFEEKMNINIYKDILLNDNFNLLDIIHTVMDKYEWIFIKEKNNINKVIYVYMNKDKDI